MHALRTTLRPALHRATATLGACAIAAATLAAPAAAQRYRVYQWDTPMAGWAEPALWNAVVAKSNLDYSHFGKTVSEQGVTAHSAEFEYGLSDRFSGAVYADFESAPGLPLRYTAARVETRYRFGDRYQRIFDPAIYVEYSIPRAKYDAAQDLEARLILQRDLSDFRLVLNPIVGRTFSNEKSSSSSGGGSTSSGSSGSAEHGGGSEMVGTEHAGSRLSGGFAGGLYWRRYHLVQPGIEYYNQIGPLGQVLALRDQRHALVPTVDLRFIPGLDWNLGLVVGLTPGSDKYTVKSVLSYEFQTIRPANRAP